jgi:predicted nucleotidyltransferase
MVAHHANSAQPEPRQPRLYFGTDVTMRVIRRYARQIAERFQPDKIILFGSHAWGTPHAESDVDLLVVMPAKDELAQAVRIRWECPAPFAMDLLVRTPSKLAWRLAQKESFSTEIATKGKVLYEKKDTPVGSQGRRRSSGRSTSRSRKQAPA